MAAYIVAVVRIIDTARFKEYSASLGDLSAVHGGESIVRGLVSDVLEGDAPAGERVVVTRFADTDAARGYINSARYQQARALREGAAEVVMRLIAD